MEIKTDEQIQFHTLPLYQLPPAWNEVGYGPIRVASNTESLSVIMKHLKKLIELDKIQKKSYIG